MTQLIAQRACGDLCHWQDQLQDELKLTMNINLSSKHFLSPTLLDDIKEILNKTGMPPEQLKLEITETALMEDADETIRLVHRLKDLGLQLVIDDFGTGYSSLSYLQRLPIDTLKVDRSFVSRIQSEPDGNRNIVEAIISLAHRLEMIVVAEGVETEEQFAILRKMNCQFGQGYLFSKPLSKPKVDELIENIIETFSRKPGSQLLFAGDAVELVPSPKSQVPSPILCDQPQYAIIKATLDDRQPLEYWNKPVVE